MEGLTGVGRAAMPPDGRQVAHRLALEHHPVAAIDAIRPQPIGGTPEGDRAGEGIEAGNQLVGEKVMEQDLGARHRLVGKQRRNLFEGRRSCEDGIGINLHEQVVAGLCGLPSVPQSMVGLQLRQVLDHRVRDRDPRLGGDRRRTLHALRFAAGQGADEDARPGHRTDHATRASVCTRAAILTQSSSESHHPHGREI